MRLARLLSLLLPMLAFGACTNGGVGSPVGESSLAPAQPNGGGTSEPAAISGETSSMAPDAKARDLVYVSNQNDGSVFAYSYPEGKLKGWLLNLQASGLCSDRNGDVFIPEGHTILEYAHGGTRPIAALHNPLGGHTQFCAVDITTGDLAVSGTRPRYGVAIYTKAEGNPRIYRNVNGGVYWSCTYDNQGNLFVEATAAGLDDAPNLVELPKGGSQLKSVAWSAIRPDRLGSIQWDGKYLAAESSASAFHSAKILRYRVSGRQATLMGQTTLANTGTPLQFWIHDAQVLVPDSGLYGLGTAGVMFYRYPGGDGPTRVIDDDRNPQAALVSLARIPKVAVTTYHYNNLRTGWNNTEPFLTYENVSGGSFGLLHTVVLDDQVDTQPLIVPNEITTTGVTPGKHDVVYLATENDTIYAIDASSGTVLFERSLGTPVPAPLGCNNNGPNVGIDGTPVIDRKTNAMYVIAYSMQSSGPAYYIHELNLTNLTDLLPPVLVSASHTLTNEQTFTFNAMYQRQRPGLLEANGNIYAGFGSFCDYSASMSRGWLLGWQAGSLTPLAANRLNDTLAVSPADFFLSSIWMSGNGIAADPSGSLYFVTGNSDPLGTSYNSVTNISETVAKVSPDLTQLVSFFTPSDVGTLDQHDEDFGSGGVLLLPKTASEPPLAAAAGKEGTLFLLNRNNLGGYTPGGLNHVIDSKYIGGCWCGESYFDAATDSVPRIVASGGNTVTVWTVPTKRPIKLAKAGYSQTLPGGQDPGFFTTVSSNGAEPGAIIWAVARPQTVPGNVTLFAFTSEPPSSGTTLETLFQAAAGTWESANGNANIVPVVANGKVYVASYEQLEIFGLLSSNAKFVTPTIPLVKPSRVTISAPHEVTATLLAISGSRLTLRTRNGKIVRVDDSDAVRHEKSANLLVGEPFNIRGAYDVAGVLHATAIVRAKPSAVTWPPDH